MSDQFGAFVSRGSVERAVLELLQSSPAGLNPPLILYYLAEAERQEGLEPHTLDPPRTYRGGVDFTVFQGDEFPAIIALVAPMGTPERHERAEYAQWFEVQAAALVSAENEDDARPLADAYGIALAALVAQNGGLGPSRVSAGEPFAIKTNLGAFPSVEFAVNATTARNLLRTTVTFQTLVQPVLTERGPGQFQADPYGVPLDTPTVETITVDIQASETLT